MSRALRVLIVEDEEEDALLLLRELRRGGYDVSYQRVDTPDAMGAAMGRQSWDLVLSDYAMPRFSAPEALALLQGSGHDLPFIIVSGVVGEERAVDAMRAGAQDYLSKDRLARLVPAVERELREAEGRRERRKIEEQLCQAQKMEAIGRLAGGVAHDFNNMLGAIIGYSDLLLHRNATDAATRGCLEEIMKAAERAAALTRQLLAFSRKEALAPRVVLLNDLVADMQELLHRLIGEDIELVTTFDPALERVKLDPSQFDQVVMNLVVNARDAMPDGGRLTVRTQNVELDEAFARRHPAVRPGPYVLLSVSDTGVGMDAETRSYIFEPFFSTKGPEKGTGLGLATVYAIVQRYGGHIDVESEPTKGATFQVFLPQVVGSSVECDRGTVPRESGEELPDLRSHAPATVLLVEDDPILRGLVSQLLRTSGYTVLEAKHGEEALQCCKAHNGPIELLLSDVVLPGINGRTVAEHVLASRPQTKVLFMSGYIGDTDLRNAIVASGMPFVQKPFRQAEFVRKVREVLGEPAPAVIAA